MLKNDLYAGYNGGPAQIVVANAISDLRTTIPVIPTNDAGVPNNNVAVVTIVDANGVSNDWRWNKTSTVADDGISIAAVNGIATGRWIKVVAAGTSVDQTAVDDAVGTAKSDILGGVAASGDTLLKLKVLIDGLTASKINSTTMTSSITTAINKLKNGVSADGDTLKELKELIDAIQPSIDLTDYLVTTGDLKAPFKQAPKIWTASEIATLVTNNLKKYLDNTAGIILTALPTIQSANKTLIVSKPAIGTIRVNGNQKWTMFENITFFTNNFAIELRTFITSPSSVYDVRFKANLFDGEFVFIKHGVDNYETHDTSPSDLLIATVTTDADSVATIELIPAVYEAQPQDVRPVIDTPTKTLSVTNNFNGTISIDAGQLFTMQGIYKFSTTDDFTAAQRKLTYAATGTITQRVKFTSTDETGVFSLVDATTAHSTANTELDVALLVITNGVLKSIKLLYGEGQAEYVTNTIQRVPTVYTDSKKMRVTTSGSTVIVNSGQAFDLLNIHYVSTSDYSLAQRTMAIATNTQADIFFNANQGFLAIPRINGVMNATMSNANLLVASVSSVGNVLTIDSVVNDGSTPIDIPVVTEPPVRPTVDTANNQMMLTNNGNNTYTVDTGQQFTFNGTQVFNTSNFSPAERTIETPPADGTLFVIEITLAGNAVTFGATISPSPLASTSTAVLQIAKVILPTVGDPTLFYFVNDGKASISAGETTGFGVVSNASKTLLATVSGNNVILSASQHITMKGVYHLYTDDLTPAAKSTTFSINTTNVDIVHDFWCSLTAGVYSINRTSYVNGIQQQPTTSNMLLFTVILKRNSGGIFIVPVVNNGVGTVTPDPNELPIYATSTLKVYPEVDGNNGILIVTHNTDYTRLTISPNQSFTMRGVSRNTSDYNQAQRTVDIPDHGTSVFATNSHNVIRYSEVKGFYYDGPKYIGERYSNQDVTRESNIYFPGLPIEDSSVIFTSIKNDSTYDDMLIGSVLIGGAHTPWIGLVNKKVLSKTITPTIASAASADNTNESMTWHIAAPLNWARTPINLNEAITNNERDHSATIWRDTESTRLWYNEFIQIEKPYVLNISIKPPTIASSFVITSYGGGNNPLALNANSFSNFPTINTANNELFSASEEMHEPLLVANKFSFSKDTINSRPLLTMYGISKHGIADWVQQMLTGTRGLPTFVNGHTYHLRYVEALGYGWYDLANPAYIATLPISGTEARTLDSILLSVLTVSATGVKSFVDLTGI